MRASLLSAAFLLTASAAALPLRGRDIPSPDHPILAIRSPTDFGTLSHEIAKRTLSGDARAHALEARDPGLFDTVKKVGGKVWDTAGNAVDTVGNTVGKVGGKVKDTAGNVVGAVGGVAGKAKDTAGNVVIKSGGCQQGRRQGLGYCERVELLGGQERPCDGCRGKTGLAGLFLACIYVGGLTAVHDIEANCFTPAGIRPPTSVEEPRPPVLPPAPGNNPPPVAPRISVSTASFFPAGRGSQNPAGAPPSRPPSLP